MDVAVLGSEHFIAGFQLAGVRKAFQSEGRVGEAFHEAMEDREIAIVIMNGDDYQQLDDRSKERAMTQVQPTVIVLSHDVSAEESLRMMIVRALGIDLWGKGV